MGIEARLEDARILWAQGRHEGAFLSALVAVAAASRILYPHARPPSSGQRCTGHWLAGHPKYKDKEAFELFLNQDVFGRLCVEFRGKVEPVYRLFYTWVRCELAHEGALPCDLVFIPNTIDGPLRIRAGGAPEFELLLSESWFWEIVYTVENRKSQLKK